MCGLPQRPAHRPSLPFPGRVRYGSPHAAFIPVPVYWAPFVDRCAPDIRRILKDPSLTREQMVDGLAFGDFAGLTS